MNTPHIQRQLEQRKAILEANIRAAQVELEKVVFALHALRGELLHAREVKRLEIRPNGTVKNLPSSIVSLLESVGRALTITDMARLWYDYSMPMSPDQLRRRLSVTASAIYRNPKPGEGPPIVPSGLRAENQEHYWALPEWVVNSQLLPQYHPMDHAP